MTRGNQREIDRMRAANRHAGKGTASEGDPLKRKENDAKALQEKIQKKAEAAVAAAAQEAAQAAATAGMGDLKIAAGGDATTTTATATATATAATTAPPVVVEKKKKPKEDLSFLDSALAPSKPKK